MGGWGCVHEVNGLCSRVVNRSCDPGMKGCVLAGRFRFSNESKNRPPAVGQAESAPTEGGTGGDAGTATAMDDGAPPRKVKG